MVRHPSTTVLVKLYGLQHGNCNPVESENISMSGENNIYYIDMIFTHGFIRCEKPFNDLFLTNVNQSQSRNDFFTRAKTVSSNQGEPVFTYQRIRSRP